MPSKDASRILTTLGWRHSVRMLISVNRNSKHYFLLTICFILIILMATYLLVWRSIASLTLKNKKVSFSTITNAKFCISKVERHGIQYLSKVTAKIYSVFKNWCVPDDLGQPSILTHLKIYFISDIVCGLWPCWYLLCISSLAYGFDDEISLIQKLSDGRCHVDVSLILVIQVSLFKLMILLTLWSLVRMVIVHISIKKYNTNVKNFNNIQISNNNLSIIWKLFV